MIYARFQTKTGAATIIQVYAPNSADPETDVDNFNNKFQEELNNVPKSDIQIIMGDLNAESIIRNGKES